MLTDSSRFTEAVCKIKAQQTILKLLELELEMLKLIPWADSRLCRKILRANVLMIAGFKIIHKIVI